MTRSFINRITNKFFKITFLNPTNKTISFPHQKFRTIRELADNLGNCNYIFREYMWDFKEFIDLKENVLKFLTPSILLNHKNLVILRDIKQAKNSCFIHIRRGDYVNIPAYTLLDMKYYRKAMDIIRNKLGDVEFFVFGNDINFIRENFSNCRIININDEDNVSFDFILMRACKNAILANSTLSIWLGFLCDGIVVYKRNTTPEIPLVFQTMQNHICI